MVLKDYPASAVGDFRRAFVRTADIILMRKDAKRLRPLLVSEKEMADRLRLPLPLVREIAAELARDGKLVIRPGLNCELYQLL